MVGLFFKTTSMSQLFERSGRFFAAGSAGPKAGDCLSAGKSFGSFKTLPHPHCTGAIATAPSRPSINVMLVRECLTAHPAAADSKNSRSFASPRMTEVPRVMSASFPRTNKSARYRPYLPNRVEVKITNETFSSSFSMYDFARLPSAVSSSEQSILRSRR